VLSGGLADSGKNDLLNRAVNTVCLKKTSYCHRCGVAMQLRFGGTFNDGFIENCP